MSITQPAQISLGIYDHFTQILVGYEGKTCNHIQVTKNLDLNGNVIDQSQTETTIYGSISNVHEKAVVESLGTLKYGDLTALFLSEDGVIMGEQITENSVRFDLIEYQDRLYTVENRTHEVFDGGVSVMEKFTLRKLAG